MKKLLTTITLLCLPVVSFAETYVCTSDDGDRQNVWTRTETGFLNRLRDNEENYGFFVILNLSKIERH